MQHHIQTLVKHFFHKDSLQEVTVNQLQQFIDDYPYSAVGQLLLAKKLGDTGAQNVDEQRAKASLYFHDPVWAGWLLKNNVNDGIAVDDEPAPESEPHFVFNNPPAETAEATTEPASSTTDTPPWSEVSAPGPEQQQPIVIEQPGAVNEFEPLREEPVIDQTAAPLEEPPQVPSSSEEAQERAVSNQPETQSSEPETHQPQTINGETVLSEPEAPQQQQEPVQPVSQPETPNAKPETEALSFEPYHTIDYFASLGIKLKPEELAKDKLGQQLKSFTDWLRSMKKVGPAKASESETELDDLTNKSIQRIADFSNEAKEIITEAMAEVWAKQGHTEKAVEIYEKLSLLNPSKSSYFAARIEALKS